MSEVHKFLKPFETPEGVKFEEFDFTEMENFSVEEVNAFLSKIGSVEVDIQEKTTLVYESKKADKICSLALGVSETVISKRMHPADKMVVSKLVVGFMFS